MNPGERPGLFKWVVGAINSSFPGLVADGSNDGIIDPESLMLESGLTWSTVVSVFVLLWTATNVMTGLEPAARPGQGNAGPQNPMMGTQPGRGGPGGRGR